MRRREFITLLAGPSAGGLGVSMVARTSQNDGCFQAYR